MFLQDHDRARARGGRGRALRHPQRTALLRRSTIPSSTPTRSTSSPRTSRSSAPSSPSSASTGSQLRLLHLGVEGLGGADAVAEGDPAGNPGHARQGRRRRGLRLLAAVAARLGRRPADHRGDPVDPRPAARLRGRRGGEDQGAAVRPVHRGAELARLRRAAGDRHHRPRPRGEPQRADQRDRQHARAARRRRLGRAVRPRLRTATTSSPRCRSRLPRQSRGARRVLRPRRDRARWCR